MTYANGGSNLSNINMDHWTEWTERERERERTRERKSEGGRNGDSGGGRIIEKKKARWRERA